MAEGCEVNIVNLADPTEPDSPLTNAIDVSFSDGPFWFFTSDGEKLQNITAVAPVNGLPGYNIPPRSAMSSDDIVDIDHSGAMQIIGSNGVTVVSPTEFNQGAEFLTQAIQLKKQNKIKVTVDGPAKSHMYVVVE